MVADDRGACGDAFALQQAAVAEFGQYVLANSELTSVFQEAAQVVVRTFNVEHCNVWQLLPEGEVALLQASAGGREGLVGRVTMAVERSSQVGYTLLSRTPVVVPDLHTDTRFTGSSWLRGRGIVSSVSLIIPGQPRPFGVLEALSTRPQSFTQGDIYFLQAIAYVLATAIERKRATEEQARHGQELALRALQAQEEERNRLARELHDDTVQILSTLLVNLDLLEPKLPAETGLLTRFEQARSSARQALTETRALAHALRPTALDDMGLVPALRRLAHEYTETFSLPIEVEVDAAATGHLARTVESAVLRIAQEALSNACRHARADRACLRLSILDDVVELVVEDNGTGFDRDRPIYSTAHGGLGLGNMRERAVLLGGTLDIDTAPGRGTRVIARVPLEAAGTEGKHRSAEAWPARAGKEPTILLVDDHAMFREGLRSVLAAQPGMAVVGEAEDGRQAIELAEMFHPDIVVMDIAMPNLNGFDATRQIRLRCPKARVIILTAHESREYLVQAVKAGAAACVVKSSIGTELVRAIDAVAKGQNYVSPTVAGTLLEDYQRRIGQDGDDLLTEREREVLQLVAEGRTNQEIARQLIVSVKTVEGHRTNIMRKLGAHDRTDLVKYAIRVGMISPG